MPIGAEERRRTPRKKRELPEVSLDTARVEVPLSGPDLDNEGAHGLPPDHSFNFRFVDRRNRVWAGNFKAHILTTREKVQVGLVRAQLSGNTPVEALDPVTYNLLEMVSVLSVALDSNPVWADDLLDLHDMGVLKALYEEVANYEARFHGAIEQEAPDSAGQQPQVVSGAGSLGANGESG